MVDLVLIEGMGEEEWKGEKETSEEIMQSGCVWSPVLSFLERGGEKQRFMEYSIKIRALSIISR